jgi:hypothetical protein
MFQAYWIALVVGAVFFDTFFLSPSKILFTKVFLLIDLRREIISLCDILLKRAAFVSRRCTGSIKSSKHLIQHFNPACRASRLLPHLSISRMLMSLNDFDMNPPIIAFVPLNEIFRLAFVAPFIMITRYALDILTGFLPDYFYNALMDFTICIILNVLFVVFAYKVSVWFCIGIFGLFFILFIVAGRYKPHNGKTAASYIHMVSNRSALLGSMTKDGLPGLDEYFIKSLKKLKNTLADDSSIITKRASINNEEIFILGDEFMLFYVFMIPFIGFLQNGLKYILISSTTHFIYFHFLKLIPLIS